jgi:hypothetical protein
MRKDIIFNSVPRSGNTFLSVSVKHAIINNLSDKQSVQDLPGKFVVELGDSCLVVYPFFHLPVMLQLPQKENFIQFTTIRDPFKTISSFTLHGLANVYTEKEIMDIFTNSEKIVSDHVSSHVLEYMEYLKEQLEKQNAYLIIFEEMVSDIDKTLKFILSKFDIKYINKVNIDEINKEIEDLDQVHSQYEAENELVSGFKYHIPRNIENFDFYTSLKSIIYKNENFGIIDILYNKLKEGATNV